MTSRRAAGTARQRGPVAALIAELRPRQWTKNLIVFAPLIFSDNLGAIRDLALAAAAFAVFCALSGAVYLLNDSVDAERDRLHPLKRSRPIAAGEMGVTAALASAVVLAIAGLTASAFISWPLLAIAASFLVLMVAYSFVLKELVIIDAMTIAAGFVLRVVAGAVAIDVSISPWLILCTALVALFLGLVKRRYELGMAGDMIGHRPTLKHYSTDFLDAMISTVTAATIIAYSFYTFFTHGGLGAGLIGGVPTSEAATAFQPWMMLTIPFVAYGMFRYLYLVHLKDLGGSPEEVLVGDLPLLVDVCLFAVVAIGVLHWT